MSERHLNIHEYTGILQDENEELAQQNKRYRELANQIISIMPHPYSKTWNKDKTLYKLDIISRSYVQELESESHETD